MADPEFIAPWYPFTVAELEVAYAAMGLSADDAALAARAFAAEVAEMSEESGYGFMEFGDFLGPVAALSPDAARRVAQFRLRWGPPRQQLHHASDENDEQ